jgi:hypothetical protein
MKSTSCRRSALAPPFLQVRLQSFLKSSKTANDCELGPDATLTAARVYGISAWDLKLTGAIQRELIITPAYMPRITVDNLEVAQVHLLAAEQRPSPKGHKHDHFQSRSHPWSLGARR